MFWFSPRCSICSKKIKSNEVVYVNLRYPSNKGMAEIKAFLNSEGKFICEQCFDKKRRNINATNESCDNSIQD